MSAMFKHSFNHPLRAIAALGAVTALAGPGVAVAADAPTQVTIDPPTTLRAGVLVGQKVTIEPGTHLAGAALRFRCPGNTRLRTFGTRGDVGFVSTRPYVGRKATSVLSFPRSRTGESVGTLYAVCR